MRNREPKLYWRKINKEGKWSFVKAELAVEDGELTWGETVTVLKYQEE